MATKHKQLPGALRQTSTADVATKCDELDLLVAALEGLKGGIG